MSVSFARRLIGLCALVAAVVAAYSTWQLWWALAGLDAFASEFSTPRPDGAVQMTRAEVWPKLEGFAVWNLNRLAVFVPISGFGLALVLGVVAARMGKPEAKESLT